MMLVCLGYAYEHTTFGKNRTQIFIALRTQITQIPKDLRNYQPQKVQKNTKIEWQGRNGLGGFQIRRS